MDHPRSAAQRIRPILQAMERSIDSARRRRTHEPEPSNTAINNPTSAIDATAHAQANARHRIGTTMIPASNPAGTIRPGDNTQVPQRQQTQPGMLPEQPARLKAKPKPASPFLKDIDQPAYRSQAS